MNGGPLFWDCAELALSYICNSLRHPGHEHVWRFGHGRCPRKGRLNAHIYTLLYTRNLTHDKANYMNLCFKELNDYENSM